MTEQSTALSVLQPGSGEMFDRIARRYDLLNRLMSMGLDRGWRKRLTASLETGPLNRVLDLATGTGDVAISIARRYPHVQVIGLDPSSGMLGVAEHKILALNLSSQIELVKGDAQSLPYEDGHFDSVSISFGIRNVPDRALALSEMVRVTRKGGTVSVLELNEPGGGLMGRLAKIHVHHIVPRLGAFLSGAREYRYLQQSIAAFPEPEKFAEMMRNSGLQEVETSRFLFGVACLFTGIKR
jgi:demethylmenaquinone methyltransferase/2-methoxy-6-polyprenyl-1,4-benzoquinol methylase